MTLLDYLNGHFDAPWQPVATPDYSARPVDTSLPIDAYNNPARSAYLDIGKVRLFVGEQPVGDGRPNWYCVGARGLVEFSDADTIVSEIPEVVARIALDHLRRDPQEYIPAIPLWSVGAFEMLRLARIKEADHTLAQARRILERTTKEREVLVALERIRPTLPPSRE